MSDLLVLDSLDATRSDAVVGRHSMWFPRLGVKVPFQAGGRIVKYTRPDEHRYDLSTLRHEVAILRALAERSMAPPVGRWVYARNLVSEFGGAWRCDPCGAYGY